ncbi:MAG: HAD-IIA family hydrolase [Bacillota bacterium]|nr:HAD-IIA family hydrolase [Bacillota bacterium]
MRLPGRQEVPVPWHDFAFNLTARSAQPPEIVMKIHDYESHPRLAELLTPPDKLAALLAGTGCFVLDMDGTIYLGGTLFPFAKDFLAAAATAGKRYIWFTNNSSRAPEDYLERLAGFGIPTSRRDFLMSTDVALDWLGRERAGETAWVVGTPQLHAAFAGAGIVSDDPRADYVVLGFDTTLTYAKLVVACDLLRAGRPLYLVNMDYNCPVEGGFIPDAGSMAALIERSTGVTGPSFGKPTRTCLDYILKQTGCREADLTFIGDRLYTDIAIARGTRAHSILVLTGEATVDDCLTTDAAPDAIVRSLADLIPLLEERS